MNSFLFVDATKIYQFKAKDSEIKDSALCLGNISKDFTINNMKKTGLKRIVKNPKVGSNHTRSAVISLDSALKKDENYYPQVFLKECKYIEKKVIRHINDNLSGFSSSVYSDNSDEQ